MPKQAKELKQFMSGTILSPSSTDIPEEAATHSLNLDPVSEQGKLKGVKEDVRQLPPGGIMSSEMRVDGAWSSGSVTITIVYDGTTKSTSAIAFTTGNDASWSLVYDEFVDETISFGTVTPASLVLTTKTDWAGVLGNISLGEAGGDPSDDTSVIVDVRGIRFQAPGDKEFKVTVSVTSGFPDGYFTYSNVETEYPGSVYQDSYIADLSNYMAVNANEFSWITSKGKDHLVYYDRADNARIKYIEDFYGSKGIVEGYEDEFSEGGTGETGNSQTVHWGIASAPERLSLQSSRSSTYIGCGAQEGNKALWFGQPKDQLGQPNEGYRLEEAECYPIDSEGKSARFAKIIRVRTTTGGVYSNYIYGFAKGSRYLYIANYSGTDGSTEGEGSRGDVLPCDPGVIAESKQAESFWIASRTDDVLYRCTVDTGTGTISAIEHYELAFNTTKTHNGSAEVDETKAAGSTIIDVLETADGNRVWVLYGQGAGSFSYNERWIYSFQIPGSPSTSNSVTLSCHTPCTKKLFRSSKGDFYEDRVMYKWRDRERYISNSGVHSRQLWRFEYNSSPAGGTDNDGDISYISDELNGDATAQDSMSEDWSKIEPTHTTYFNNDSPGSAHWDNILPGRWVGWKDDPGLEIRPKQYGLVDLGVVDKNSLGSSYSATQYRVGIIAYVKGKLCKSPGQLRFHHYDTGTMNWGEKFRFIVRYAPEFESYDEVAMITTSSDAVGLAVYNGINSTNGEGFKYADSLGSTKDIPCCVFNADKFLGIKRLGSSGNTNADNETASKLNGVGEVVDHSRLLGPTNKDTFVLSRVGTDTTKTHLQFYDTSNMLDQSKISETIPLKNTAFVQPYTYKSTLATTSASNFHESFNGGLLTLFTSTSAGLYENGVVKFTGATAGGTITEDTAYDTNDGSPADYGIIFSEGASGSNFLQGQEYFYKMSVLYDGFQESPLNLFYFSKTPSSDRDTLIGTVFIKKPPIRASHILIYRKNSADEFYRLVKEMKLDSSWIYDESSDIYSGTFVDNAHLGATYESITGVSEVLRDTSLNYEVSTTGNNCLIVGNCTHPELTNGDHFVVKSKPGTWSIFDWSEDYVTLPNVPTTLKYFAGRIFAWDKANMHKIGFQSMSIEDSYEGIGCLGEQAVVVTDLGMFFADRNNIYKHDGNMVQPIGDPILRSSLNVTEAYPWQDIVHSYTPRLLYDSAKQSILVCFETNGVYRAWSFNVLRNRWDLIEIPKPQATILGQYGESFLSDGKHLFNLQSSDTSTKKWSYWTKNVDFGSRGLEKKLFNIKVTCDDKDKLLDTSTNLKIIQDGTEVTDGTWSDQSSDALADIRKFTLDTSIRDTYAVSLRLDNQETEVDALTFIWKPKTVK